MFRINLNNILQLSLLIVDPQYLTRQGLFHLLDKEKHIRVTAFESFPSNEELETYDVIIIDYLDPYTYKVRLGQVEYLLNNPSSRYLIISSDQSRNRIRNLIDSGVNGYLTKDCQPEEILAAVEMISKSNRYYCNKVLEILVRREENNPEDYLPTILSLRELEVLKLIATGFSSIKMAEKLHISVHTINSHRKNLLKKLSLTSPTQLVAYAHEKGLV